MEKSKNIEIENQTTPTVEFTEDNWNTIYTGSIVGSSIYSYLVRSSKYGSFWIPKCYVREINKK